MFRKILLLVAAIPLFIGWMSNPNTNTAVCTADQEQKRPQAVSDNNGGVIIVWEDSRGNSDYDIYAQGIDSAGNNRWRTNGVALCTVIGPQRSPHITVVGADIYIATWIDRRNGKDNDIYAQCLDGRGNLKWLAEGVPICKTDGEQYDPILVADGKGGAIIAWQDRRNGSDYDIYAQRIDAQGQVQWMANGVGISTARFDQELTQGVADGSGGMIITWQDWRNGGNFDIFAQKIDFRGILQWHSDGIGICTESEDQRNPQIVADNRGGAIITWQDKRTGRDYDIYAQRVDSSGNPQWTTSGVPICTVENSQYDPRLAADGEGGAVVTWQDYRKGSECSFDAFAQQTDHRGEVCEIKQLNDWNVFAQAINSSGKIQWAANGIAVSTAQVDQFKPQPLADGFGNTIITWQAPGKGNHHNIYAQCLNSTGSPLWAAQGIPISTAPGDQLDPLPVSDGHGGAIITWYDKRNENQFDIYTQKICASGEMGNCSHPVAVINANPAKDSASLTMQFDGRSSYDPDGSVTTWSWDFGDGQKASSDKPNHIYAKSGNYTVTLRVRDNSGKWSLPTQKAISVRSNG